MHCWCEDMYPLVMTNIAMENHHVLWENSRTFSDHFPVRSLLTPETTSAKRPGPPWLLGHQRASSQGPEPCGGALNPSFAWGEGEDLLDFYGLFMAYWWLIYDLFMAFICIYGLFMAWFGLIELDWVNLDILLWWYWCKQDGDLYCLDSLMEQTNFPFRGCTWRFDICECWSFRQIKVDPCFFLGGDTCQEQMSCTWVIPPNLTGNKLAPFGNSKWRQPDCQPQNGIYTHE